MANDEKIEGGFLLLARKITSSGLMEKPPLYLKLWIWMLEKARYKDGQKLKKGQFKTSIKEMQEAMSYMVGYRRETPTAKQIRAAYEYFASSENDSKMIGKYEDDSRRDTRRAREGHTKGTMIGITKVTDGMIITINNYCRYQEPKNYEGHSVRHDEIPTNGQRRASEGAHLNKEKEGKKEKERKNGKKKDYAELVRMTEDEFGKLVEKHGEDFTQKCISLLDNYKGAHGKKYKSDYRAILQWVVDAVNEKGGVRPKQECIVQPKPFDPNEDLYA